MFLKRKEMDCLVQFNLDFVDWRPSALAVKLWSQSNGHTTLLFYEIAKRCPTSSLARNAGDHRNWLAGQVLLEILNGICTRFYFLNLAEKIIVNG